MNSDRVQTLLAAHFHTNQRHGQCLLVQLAVNYAVNWCEVVRLLTRTAARSDLTTNRGRWDLAHGSYSCQGSCTYLYP